MNNYTNALNVMQEKNVADDISRLYGKENLECELDRYLALIKKHELVFNSEEKLYMISAPGRIELVGNHTDHNKGKVLTAGVNKDSLACVSKRNDNIVEIYSDGYEPITVDLNDIELDKSLYNTTIALVKGVAYCMKEKGYKIGGFNACINSTVLSGSGLSSSASIETLLVSIFDGLYNKNDMSPVEKAKIGQYAENVYFGKPSGLLDQSASALGSLVYIDFKYQEPNIIPIELDFAKYGYSIIVVNTNSSHDNLTNAYASIPKEMKAVANIFNKEYLIDVSYTQIIENLAEIRSKLGERPLLRAKHFYDENNRVEKIVQAINNNDIQNILKNIIDSGKSSFMYLQNIYVNENYQPMSLALALAEDVLQGKGAWRIHGGGFAGTTLNIVPYDTVNEFEKIMNGVFGKGSCIELNIRPVGSHLIVL